MAGRLLAACVGAAVAINLLTVVGAGFLVGKLGPCHVTAFGPPDVVLCVDHYWGRWWVPIVLLVICVFALAIAAVVAMVVAVRQVLRAARLRMQLLGLEVPPPAIVEEIALEIGYPVRVCQLAEPLALTVGIRRPGILLSTWIIDRLTPLELRAVLEHEAAHCDARDPRRYVLARVAATLGLALPVLPVLARHVTLEAELAADCRACHAVGVHPLAGAMHRLIGAPPVGESLAVGSISGFLAERVAAMSGTPPRFRAPARLWVVSATSLLASILVILASVNVRLAGG